MRFGIALMLVGALAFSGCDSDEGSNGTGGSGGTAGTGGTAGSGGDAGAGGMGGGAAPVIAMVEWSTGGDCMQFTDSDYTVIVTATDADSDPMDLVYAGSVDNCNPGIDAMTSVISCPNNAPYAGMVVVSDGDGNDSEPFNFSIGVCETSSAP
jgi:hypothetical protein